jgi:hypothetical protein
MAELIETSGQVIRKKHLHEISGLNYETELFAKNGNIRLHFWQEIDKFGVLVAGAEDTLAIYLNGHQVILKQGNNADITVAGFTLIADILDWAYIASDLFGSIAAGAASIGSATDATILLVRNAVQAMDLQDATEATQLLVKNILTTISASQMTEATGILVKNILTGIQTNTANVSTENTLILVKNLLDAQLTKLTQMNDNLIPVSTIEMLDRRTFVRITVGSEPGNCTVNIVDIVVNGIAENIASVAWGFDANADNVPDVNSNATFTFTEYGVYPVLLKLANGMTFRFIIPFYPTGIAGVISTEFSIFHTADGRINLKRYYKLLQKTATGVVDLGAFDETGVAYLPVNADDGTLKLIEDANERMAFDFPEVIDVTASQVLKAFKFHEILVQPTLGSSCDVGYDADAPVALEALEVHRVVATTKINRMVLITNVVGTVRVSTLR